MYLQALPVIKQVGQEWSLDKCAAAQKSTGPSRASVSYMAKFLTASTLRSRGDF
jgi:hypothetical protein